MHQIIRDSLFVLFLGGALCSQNSITAADFSTEADYYRWIDIPIPKGIVLEVGGIEELPGEKIAVSSRRGDIYFIEGAFANPPKDVKFTKFAGGLHEVLGLSLDKDGWLYATQRGELSRLKDTNHDGKADIVETISDGWEINGDYHEYAFGSPFDKNGHAWVVLCLTGSFDSHSKYRGWCLRIDKEGNVIPTCSGIRSPGGIGFNADGDVFYTDNQGPWNGTCSLKWLRPGSFQGHPAGNRWYDLPEVKKHLGEKPQDPKSGSRIMTEAKKIPEYEPPAVLFPYDKMGKSAAGIACDLTKGKFGPFEGQMMVTDQSYSTVMRCFLEKIQGHYQGACFMLREGGGSGNLALKFAHDGSLLVGGTNRGWGSRGRKPFALERLVWTGKTPFEVQEMRAKPDGFELTFTQPVDKATAENPASYQMQTYCYIYQASYGSPEVDHTEASIKSVRVAEDGKSARLIVEGLQEGHVHELHMEGIRSQAGLPLLHNIGYYTLNYIPKSESK